MPKKSLSVPTPRRLPSGKWFIQMRLGGQSYSVTAATEKECIRQATLIKSQYKSGQLSKPVVSTELTIGERFDKYIELKEPILSPTTVKKLQTIRRTRFKSIMNKKVSEIADWQEVVNKELLTCEISTVKYSLKTLFTILEIHQKVSYPQEAKKEKAFLQPEQISIFIDAMKDTPAEIAVLLGLHSLRCSEILGLKWEDVDLQKGIIHVNGAIVQGPNGLVEKETNKNETSNRYIPILIPRLKELLLSSQKDGKHVVNVCRGTIANYIIKACKKEGLPQISIHGLRHSFASLCYHLGLSEKVTMKLGGWANPTVMHAIYTHLADKDISESTQKLADFFSANKNANGP